MKRDFIIGWFAENSTLSREELEKDLTINYLEAGVIDSFGFLDLISACEEKLGIAFSDDDFSKGVDLPELLKGRKIIKYYLKLQICSNESINQRGIGKCRIDLTPDMRYD